MVANPVVCPKFDLVFPFIVNYMKTQFKIGGAFDDSSPERVTFWRSNGREIQCAIVLVVDEDKIRPRERVVWLDKPPPPPFRD